MAQRDNRNGNDRVVIVTGASSGIGAATAARFRESGDVVLNVDIAAPLEPEHSALWYEVDITAWDAVADVVSNIERVHGRVDVAIANAGISLRRPILSIDRESLQRVLDTNLLGVFCLWQTCAESMLRTGGGVLLATASTNGNVGYPHYADYNASKAAVLSLCRSFALEFSPTIRACCVSPGYVMTPMQRTEYTDEQFAEINNMIPLDRHADPREVADAFHFLASASYITGQQLIIDGGELAGGMASKHSTQAQDTSGTGSTAC